MTEYDKLPDDDEFKPDDDEFKPRVCNICDGVLDICCWCNGTGKQIVRTKATPYGPWNEEIIPCYACKGTGSHK